jgi:hypothetical protein
MKVIETLHCSNLLISKLTTRNDLYFVQSQDLNVSNRDPVDMGNLPVAKYCITRISNN